MRAHQDTACLRSSTPLVRPWESLQHWENKYSLCVTVPKFSETGNHIKPNTTEEVCHFGILQLAFHWAYCIPQQTDIKGQSKGEETSYFHSGTHHIFLVNCIFSTLLSHFTSHSHLSLPKYLILSHLGSIYPVEFCLQHLNFITSFFPDFPSVKLRCQGLLSSKIDRDFNSCAQFCGRSHLVDFINVH